MTDLTSAGTYRLGDRDVKRIGYGAMQLAGPGVFGPPRDRDQALAVLRAAVGAGVDHIDTSDYYGPFVVNHLIREALAPYADDLVLVSKVGARRDEHGAWLLAMEPDELCDAIRSNLDHLGLEAMEVVNLRSMFSPHGPAEGSLEAPLTVLAELQQQGLVRHIGLSNVTPTQVAEGRKIVKIACVQNQYNLAHREDEALVDQLAADGIAYVPFFPLGGFAPLQSDALDAVATRAWRNGDAGGAGVAARPLAQHPADPGNVLTGAFARESRGRLARAGRRRHGPARPDRRGQRTGLSVAYAPMISRPISMRRISLVPAPMSSSLASRMKRSTGQSLV